MYYMINNVEIGEQLQIQCYKHNGKIHRSWNEALVLAVKNDYIVCGNNEAMVTEANGATWKTKEPAIMYFFKDRWYNIIAQFKSDGIYYYCNIASPCIVEENTIKYIDYDLDLRIFSNGKYKVLDRMEYIYHKKSMNYSPWLDRVINNSLDELIKDYNDKIVMFNREYNLKYYNTYINLKKIKKMV